MVVLFKRTKLTLFENLGFRIRDIAAGSSHSAAVTSSGELYTWGFGEYGRLGHGDCATQLLPKRVCAPETREVIRND